MPAPVTSILDDFNRANENPLSDGARWTNVIGPGDVSLQVLSNQLANPSAVSFASAWWNAKQFTGDMESYITLAVKPTVQLIVYVAVRNPGTASISGYAGGWNNTVGFRIWRVNNNVYTNIGTTAGTPTNGDKLALRITGHSLVLSQFVAASSTWTDRVTATDSAFVDGFVGVSGSADTTWRCDDFGGGSIAADSFDAKWAGR